MKLWYSTTSPFARKVMAVIKHHNLEEKIEFNRITASFDANSPHNQANPLGRVPALQRNCGRWLYGSLLIAEYLDNKGTNTALLPKEGKIHWNILALHNLVDGISENTMPVIAEKMFRPENEWWKARHEQVHERNFRSFQQLEAAFDEFGMALNLGTITAVCFIDWWLFRADKMDIDLTKHFPRLTNWATDMYNKFDVLAETIPTI